MKNEREVWVNPSSQKIGHINYRFILPLIRFTGGRNQVHGRKISLFNKPYANFSASIGKNNLFTLHAWINNEGNWGLYYNILNLWTFGNGKSCYGHHPHCDIRGSYIPTFQKTERNY